ncbi:metal-binding protein ZinT [Rhodobacteraceae bacterium D3-12]|nr:metal-binding protein ZinT [Rhodobacteraceae bacterium D3-12]
MTKFNARAAALLVASGLALSTAPAIAQTAASSDTKTHKHSHDTSEQAKQIYKGYFEDAQIAPRALTDWAGDWQSIYPLLKNGDLDEVWAHKAEHSDKTAEQYRAYYDIGYKTDVDRIMIDATSVTFFRPTGAVSANYESDGYEILNYKKGNRGVRFSFRKTGGDAAAPMFIQFSDHHIAPKKVGHYHIYWGNDRDAVLAELTNWPTYFPTNMSAHDIAHDMIAH